MKMGNVDAIILAGGLGTRLKGIAPDLPKALMPVNGKPFLEILLRVLDRCGRIDKVILAVGHMADRIIERYSDSASFGFDIAFSVEKSLLGTGGAIRMALEQSGSDDVLVLNGDSFVEVDYGELLAAHEERKAALTLVVKEVPDAGRFGTVSLDRDGRVFSFEEKKEASAGGFINAGVYLLKRSLFDGVEKGKVLSMEKDVLPSFLGGAVYGFVSRGKFIDIGIPETYRASAEYLKGIVP